PEAASPRPRRPRRRFPRGGAHCRFRCHLSERGRGSMSDRFDGLGMGLGNLARLSNAESRSVSAENPTGAKGRGGMAPEGPGATAARDFGGGWKVSPSMAVPAIAGIAIAGIGGPGAIQHVWLTVHPTAWRRLVFRCFWDGEEAPSIQAPLGDFFCNG